VWRDGEAINPRRDPNMPWGLARDGDVSAPTLAATANPGGESVARRETHLPGSPAALLALLDAPAAGGDYNAKPAWMAATGIAGRDWGTTTIPSFLGHKDVTRRSELPDRLNHPYHQLRSGSSREVMSASMKQCRQSA
jgi:hypothetical protein